MEDKKFSKDLLHRSLSLQEREKEGEVNNLPKVELHLHLDCSLSYEVVKKKLIRLLHWQHTSMTLLHRLNALTWLIF